MSSRSNTIRSLCACALALGATPAEPGSLSVRALDPQGTPIPGAMATLYTDNGQLRLRGVTDAEGRHRFEALVGGDYVVDVSASGFAAASALRLRLAPDDDAEAEFALRLAPFHESVVVTAAAAPQTSAELSKALTTVDAAEMDERDEHTVSEALRRVPGVRVQQRGGPGALTSIRVRGLRSEDTSVLIDGVRFRDPAATQGDASGFVSDLIATDLDRVEVLRGSGSSLYGTNAIGGVVNLITEPGGGPSRGGLLAEGGSLGFFRGRARIAGGGRSGPAWSAGLSQMNAFDGVGGDQPARNTSGQGQLQLPLGSRATLTTRLYAADTEVQLTESPRGVGALPPEGILDAVALSDAERRRYEAGTPVDELELDGANYIPNAADPDSDRRARFVSALVRLEQRPTPRLGWSLSYHGLWTDRSFGEGPAGVSGFEPAGAAVSDFEGRLHTVQARADVGLGDAHRLTAGWELEQESFLSRDTPGDPALDSLVDATQRSQAGFLRIGLQLAGGALQIEGSGRGQFFDLRAPRFDPVESSPYRDAAVASPPTAWTGDLAAVYRLGEGTRIRAHAGNGYRAPSLYERFGTSFGSFGYSVFGDPRLAPERSLGVDAGVDASLAGGAVRLSGTLFQTRLREVIVFDFSGAIAPESDPFGRFGGYRSVEGGRTRGVELSVSASPAPGLRLAAAWTFNDAEPPAEGAGDADRAFAIPRHQLALVATQQLGAFYVNLDVALSGDYLAPIFDPASFRSRSYRFDGMAKLDLGTGYRLDAGAGRQLRLFAKVDDLLDRADVENGFRTPGRTAFAGAAFEF